MKNKIFKALVQRYQDGDSTDRERHLVDQWYDSFDEDENVEAPKEAGARIFKSIEKKIKADDSKRGRENPNIKWVLSIAATIAVCFGITSLVVQWNQEQANTTAHEQVPQIKFFQTEVGQRKRITLPDSSILTLNALSQVRIDLSTYNKEYRKIDLIRGEVFFQVHRDTLKPFVVKSERLQTQVLGTSFTIKAYAEQPEQLISVYSGKVQVTCENQMLGILKRGQQIRFDKLKSNRITEAFNFHEGNEWITGVTHLRQASFNELALTLKNYYGLTLQANSKKIANQQYTLPLKSSASQTTILQVISMMHQNKYRKEGDVVIIY